MKEVLRLSGSEWWKDFVILPLEVIRDCEQNVSVKDRVETFRRHSLRIEGFWINKLRSYGQSGLNTEHVPGTKRTMQRRQRSRHEQSMNNGRNEFRMEDVEGSQKANAAQGCSPRGTAAKMAVHRWQRTAGCAGRRSLQTSKRGFVQSAQGKT